MLEVLTQLADHLLPLMYSLRVHDSALVTIGSRVLIAPNVTIVTERHGVEVQSRRDGIVYAQPVTIGDDCWIGVNATILPGVTIGKGSVIGAGAVVTRDIPPFSLAWGVPARVQKKVDDPDAAVVILHDEAERPDQSH
jgi:acetyltransferase-like isoleucine patch superfamily enzyme